MKTPSFSIVKMAELARVLRRACNWFRCNDLRSCAEGKDVAAALRQFLRSVVERDAWPRERVGSPLQTCRRQGTAFSFAPNPPVPTGKRAQLPALSFLLCPRLGMRDGVR